MHDAFELPGVGEQFTEAIGTGQNARFVDAIASPRRKQGKVEHVGLDKFIEEVGGGLNFKRKRFLALMDEVGRREIKTLILAHRDRLTRFGFEWFEHFAEANGCEVLVLNQERLSPEQEMVQDLMTIVHCFSSRLYGLRNYRKKLDEALKKDAEHDLSN